LFSYFGARFLKDKELKHSLTIAIEAARRAQGVFQKSLGTSRQIMSKSGREVKVNLDTCLDTEIIEVIRQQSDLPILSEESDHVREDGLWWIVDPLDGSLNWLRNIPFFSISIGLFRGTDPILGVVLNLDRDELSYGVVGLGAWLNDSPIRVSGVTKKDEAVLCTGFPSSYNFRASRDKSLESVYSEYLKIRMFGSAAMSLAYVAKGAVDIYWEEKVKFWDVAAGIALVQAGGGNVRFSRLDKDFTLSVEAAACKALFPKRVTE